jgi:hypothetical protein
MHRSHSGVLVLSEEVGWPLPRAMCRLSTKMHASEGHSRGCGGFRSRD